MHARSRSRRWVIGAAAVTFLGWCAGRSPRDERRPSSKTEWGLWAKDLFDRESPPHRDLTGKGIVNGLAALWEREARQGIQDDGRRSFTAFSLEWGPSIVERVFVDVVPGENPDLLKIRRWARPDVFVAIGEAHARLLDASDRWDGRPVDPGSESHAILRAARGAATSSEFLRALEKLK